MPEDQNIAEGNPGKKILQSKEVNADEIISQQQAIEQTETENSKQETENMEVHHHPHVEKKSFKEYFLEFLMIFLAVTLGFFAEGLRESLSDKEKEKQYIESFVQNLEQDTSNIKAVIAENNYKMQMLDSLIRLSLTDVARPENRLKLYSYCFQYVGRYSLFKSNDATMLQLTNSGGLRVIQKDHVADSIAKYANELKSVYAAEEVYSNGTNEAINATHELLDYSVYYDTVYFKQGGFTSATLPLLITDARKIKLFFNKIDFEVGSTRNYINNLKRQLPYMQRMIEFLKMEYDIE